MKLSTEWGIAPFCGAANLPEKVSRDVGYCSDSIAISRDMGPLRFHRATEVIPRRDWKSKSPFASSPIKIMKATEGRKRCARGTTRYFHRSFPSYSRPVVQSHWSPIGGTPSTVKHFRTEIRNKSGNTPETLSEQILKFQVSYGWRSRNPGK